MPARKVIIMPVFPVEPATVELKASVQDQMAQRIRQQLLAYLEERRKQPKPFNLLRFLFGQGENLASELADGVTHYALYLRYLRGKQIPEDMPYSTFAQKLALFRKHKGLPPRYKPRAESVTDPSLHPVHAGPATPPATGAGPPRPARRRGRRAGHDWDPLGR